MKSKKTWSFDVHCRECGSFLECELEDIYVEMYSGVRLVQCCDCDSPVGVGHVTLPTKLRNKIRFSPLRSAPKFDYRPLLEGVKVLSEEEENRIIEAAQALRGVGVSLVTTGGN